MALCRPEISAQNITLADYKLNDWRLFFFGPQNFLENLSFALIQVGSPPYAI